MLKNWRWVIGVLAFSSVAYATIQWGNLDVKGNLSVTGTQSLVGATTFWASPTFSSLTASRVPYINGSGALATSSVTDTELGYLSGVTSAIQTQINTKAPSSSPTFTTPTLDIAILDGQGSTPANPSAGYYKAYVKDSTGKLNLLDSSGAETEIGSGGGGSSGINILGQYNPSAAAGTTYWSETGGGTLTTTSTAANVADMDSAAFSYDCSANNDYVESDARAIPAGLNGKNCLAEAYINGFDANATLQVTDGSTVLNSVVLAAQTTYPKYQLNFVCPTSGNLKFKILCTGNAAIGYFDAVHLGEAKNLFDTNNAIYLGALTTVCSWTQNTTCTGNYWKDGDFLIGNVQAVGTGTANAATLTFTLPNSLAIDTNKVKLTGSAQGLEGTWRGYDTGDNGYQGFVGYVNSTTISLWRPITKDGNALSELYYGNNVTHSAPFTFNNTDVYTAWFRVPISGWNASTAINPNQYTNWGVAVWDHGVGKSFSSSGGAAWTDASDADFATRTNYGGAADPASTSTLGIKMPSLPGGLYEVKFSGRMMLDGSNNNGFCGFRLYDGTTVIGNAHSIEGTSTGNSDTYLDNIIGYVYYTSQADREIKVQVYDGSGNGTAPACLVTFEGTVDQKAFISLVPVGMSLAMPILVGGVVARDNTVGATTINTIVSKSSTYTATHSEETIVFTADSTLNLPAAASYKGKRYFVTSSGAATDVTIDPNSSETVCGQTTIQVNGERDGVEIQSDGTNWIGLNNTCIRNISVSGTFNSTSIAAQDGNCVSAISAPGAGQSGVTLVSGCWSAAPRCTCTADESTASSEFCTFAGIPSTSSVTLRGRVSTTGTLTAALWNMICRGPR